MDVRKNRDQNPNEKLNICLYVQYVNYRFNRKHFHRKYGEYIFHFSQKLHDIDQKNKNIFEKCTNEFEFEINIFDRLILDSNI